MRWGDSPCVDFAVANEDRIMAKTKCIDVGLLFFMNLIIQDSRNDRFLRGFVLQFLLYVKSGRRPPRPPSALRQNSEEYIIVSQYPAR
jgi:hypothetical protein